MDDGPSSIDSELAVKLVPIEKEPFRYDIPADKLNGPIPEFAPTSEEDLDQWERESEERLERGSC